MGSWSDPLEIFRFDGLPKMIEIVPSSARSTSSPAIQLPEHLISLLSKPVQAITAAVDAVLPPSKSKTHLEEAENGDSGDEGFEQHIVSQCQSSFR